jgi:alanine racemase
MPASGLDQGLMLYGIDPVSENPSGLCPAMTFKAPVIAVNTVRAGATIGYGSTWRAPAEMTVAVLAVGYADGYPREIGTLNPRLVRWSGVDSGTSFNGLGCDFGFPRGSAQHW